MEGVPLKISSYAVGTIYNGRFFVYQSASIVVKKIHFTSEGQ